MIVVISSSTGEHAVAIKEDREQPGYRVVDGAGLLDSSPGFVCFIENLSVGTHPWVSYYKEDPSGIDFSFCGSRLPLQKSRILRVERQFSRQ